MRVDRWNVGPLRLSPQVVYAEHLGLPPHVDGLLGSDVLSRFGTIRLDYDQAQLIVAKAEGPALASGAVQGRIGQQLPAAFASFDPQETLPIAVVTFDGAVEATAPVSIGARTFHLAIDSGADNSTIAASKVRGLGLTQDHRQIQLLGVGGEVSATEERVTSWSVGWVRLVPEDLVATTLPGGWGPSGIDGLLGADVLSQFRGVTIDYADGILGMDQVPVL